MNISPGAAIKTGQSRIDDAVAYIYQLGKAELANHVATLARPHASKIGGELSLGSRPDGKDDPAFASNTRKRNALRALLLLQRVYFSDLWWTLSPMGGVQPKATMLAKDWKATSLRHWSPLPEAEIEKAILAFAPSTALVDNLINAVTAMPDPTVAQPDLTLTREKAPFPGNVSCYGAVMAWLFNAGLVSYRWYARHSGAMNKATLEAAFGKGRRLIGPNDPFDDKSVFPIVPVGHIVHLYSEESGGVRWNGHWMISLGGGRGAGCNNDDTDGTNRVFTPNASLANQFYNGYRDAVDGQPGKTWKGVVDVIDPLDIPERI